MIRYRSWLMWTALLLGLVLAGGNSPIPSAHAQSPTVFQENFNSNELGWRMTSAGGISTSVADGKFTIEMKNTVKDVAWFTYPNYATAPKVAAAYEYTFKVSGGSCEKPGYCFLAVVYNIGSSSRQNILMYYLPRDGRVAYSLNSGRHNATSAASSDLPDVFSGGTFTSTLRVTRDELIWTVGNKRVIRFVGPHTFDGTIGFGVARYSDKPVDMKLSFDDVTIRSVGGDQALKATATPFTVAASAEGNLANVVSLYWEKRDTPGAKQAVQAAIAANASLADAYAWRAYLNLVTSGSTPEKTIEADLKKAFSLDAQNALAFAARSHLEYSFNKNPEAAFRDAEKAVALAPTSRDVNAWVANVYYLAKDYDKALKHMAAINPFPDYARLHNLHGLIYSAAGDDDNALRQYNKVITLDPQWATGYSNRASVNLRQKALPTVIKDILKAAQLQPGSGVGVARNLFVNHFLPKAADLPNRQGAMKVVPLITSSRYDSTNVPLWVEEIYPCYTVALEKGRFAVAQRYATTERSDFFFHSAAYLFDSSADAQAGLDKIREVVRQCHRRSNGQILRGAENGAQEMFFAGSHVRGLAVVRTYVQMVTVQNMIFTFSINTTNTLAKDDWVSADQLKSYMEVFTQSLRRGLELMTTR